MDRALKERIIGAVVLVAIAVLVVPVFLDGPVPDREMISEPVLLPGQSGEPGARRTVVLERDRDQPLPDAAQDAARPARASTAGEAKPEPAGAQASGASAPPAAAPQDTGSAAAPARPQPEPGATPADKPPADTARVEAAARPGTDTPPREAAARPQPEATQDAPAGSAAPAAAESATGMWAVQLGSFSNKANADRLAASLREDGYAAFISRHAGASGELHRVRIGPQEDRASAEAVAARLSAKGMKGQVVPHP